MLIVGQVQISKFVDSLPAGSNPLGSVEISNAVAIASGSAVSIDPNGNGMRLTEALPAGTNHLGSVEISNASVPVSADQPLPVRETFEQHEILNVSATSVLPATGTFSQPVSQVLVMVDADCRVSFGAGDPTTAGLPLKKGESLSLPLKVTMLQVIGETGAVTARVVGLR